MVTDPVTDTRLRAARRPSRPEVDGFAANVRARPDRLGSSDPADPLADVSPFVRAAATSLPLPVIAGGKAAGLAKGWLPSPEVGRS